MYFFKTQPRYSRTHIDKSSHRGRTHREYVIYNSHSRYAFYLHNVHNTFTAIKAIRFLSPSAW